MKVQATEKGFYDGKLRQAGEVFDVKDGEKASWFTPRVEIGKEAEGKPAKKPAPPPAA